ncbi:hypothetical protein SUGI_0203360 [Cryptomeria japonica]|nr:hypothetical protein SUGI_0203360 [Cryptomeria japonica]
MKGKKVLRSILHWISEYSGGNKKSLMKPGHHLVGTSLPSEAESPDENYGRDNHVCNDVVIREQDVDRAAEDFIVQFYRNLQMQNMVEDQTYQGYLARSAA